MKEIINLSALGRVTENADCRFICEELELRTVTQYLSGSFHSSFFKNPCLIGPIRAIGLNRIADRYLFTTN